MPVENEYNSVLFFQCIKIIWNKINADGLCFSIFIKDMGWYLGVIGRLHNESYHIYIYIYSSDKLKMKLKICLKMNSIRVGLKN